MIDTSHWLDAFTNDLLAQVQRELRVGAYYEDPKHAASYLDGVDAGREGSDIVVTVKGLIPNFLEHGLGPGGMGTEGPFDIRQNVLKNGRERQAIPVQPGVFRTMLVKGKPWMHPGFKRLAMLPKIQMQIERLAREAEYFGSAFKPSDDWRYDPTARLMGEG